MGTFESINSIYYANLYGLPMSNSASSSFSFGNPFSFSPSASSIFGGTWPGFMSGFTDFSNPFSSFGSFGNFGGFDAFSSPFAAPFSSNFGGFTSSPFDFNFSPQFGTFQNFNFLNMFKPRNRSNSYVNEPPGRVKHRNVRVPLSQKCKEMVAQIEKELNFEPHSLEKVMIRESGCNPQARNPDPRTKATGLIQFTKSTARRYGTTVDELIKMTAEEQMPYVRRYMKQSKKEAGYSPGDYLSAGEVYGLVFMPGLIKRGGGYKAGSDAYRGNTALDTNNNGIINKYDLDKVMEGIHIKS